MDKLISKNSITIAIDKDDINIILKSLYGYKQNLINIYFTGSTTSAEDVEINNDIFHISEVINKIIKQQLSDKFII